jgi:uncharacterized coiled-coil protein SlyX
MPLLLQAAAEAQQAVEELGAAADSTGQQLSTQLAEQAAEGARLREQLKQLSAELLDVRGQQEVQATQTSMLEAREKQHEQQVQEQAAKIKERAAELESAAKELQVLVWGGGRCSTTSGGAEWLSSRPSV